MKFSRGLKQHSGNLKIGGGGGGGVVMIAQKKNQESRKKVSFVLRALTVQQFMLP